jgi:hypothetical protein
LQEMLKFFQIKYRNNEIGFIIHSIYYFEDAENQTDPISLNGQTWEKVKQKIVRLANDFINKNI